ncbi:unnamed protein product [Mycena citricolor]|uniref:CASTOR ACT domain-containing protein n=1 Tax=Mycena citricolor TaxID=2018698 RepID=A0AAD2GVC9_9AGAR|nr:unnamed protein product [Mycena citricolor]
MQVTITRLPTVLSVVSIPRSHLDRFTHPVLRTLLLPNPSFLSVTCNEIELSIFAEPQAVDAFDAFVKSGNGYRDGMEVSHERWCVLQIDSHSDQLDNAGARVSELSAPLAAAGISILYLSSYTSDYIFVKERRLAEAMSLFAAAGFSLYASHPDLLTALISVPPGPVLRERSGSAPVPPTSASRSSSKSSSSKSKSRSKASKRGSARAQSTPDPSIAAAASSSSQPPKMATIPAIRILAPDLACVGLVDTDDMVAQWALKVVKLVAFPDLIPLPGAAKSPGNPTPRGRGTPLMEEVDDGYFSHSSSPSPNRDKKDIEEEPQVSRSPPREMPSRLDGLPPALEFESTASSSTSWLSGTVVTEPFPKKSAPNRSSSIQDGHAPRTKAHDISFYSFTRTPDGSSLTTSTRVLSALFPPEERHMVICGSELDESDRERDAWISRNGSSGYTSMPSSPVISVPPRWESRRSEDSDDDEDISTEDEDDEDDEDSGGHSLMSALQIDLRSTGLDTHGLVHRFSRALAGEESITCMHRRFEVQIYSSRPAERDERARC